MLTFWLIVAAVLAFLAYYAVRASGRKRRRIEAEEALAVQSQQDFMVEQKRVFGERAERYLSWTDYADNWAPDPAREPLTPPRCHPKRTETATLREGLEQTRARFGCRGGLK